MSKVRVAAFGISIDGFGAGLEQSLDNPLGVHGPELMQWFFPTRTFHRMHDGSADGTTGTDDGFALKGFENVAG